MHSIVQDPFRILVADDEKEYIDLYHHVLAADSPFHNAEADAYETDLFKTKRPVAEKLQFDITSCRQGNAAIDLVKKSIQEKRPFSVAFLDVRMPPGPDGIWVAKQIRKLDPLIEIAIVTGYSDYTLEDIVSRVPPIHKLIYIQKPFKLREIYHFAHTLSSKRHQENSILSINRTLEKTVAERTRELKIKNKQLTREIEQRTQAEEALRKSEQGYRLLVEKQMDMIVKFDPDYRLLFVSPSYCITHGKKQEELLGENLVSLIHEEARDSVVRAIKNASKPPYTAYVEERALTRHGWRWFAWVYTTVLDKDNAVSSTLAVGRDITERKEVELDLKESKKKLRVLYSHLITAQEEERKRIASDLHDDLGQTLAMLKLRIQSIQRELDPDQSALIGECEGTLNFVNQIIDQVRSLSHDLTPTLLDDLGLADSLKALANEFARLSRTQLSTDIDKIDHLFPAASEVIIYRVFQEILTNIDKHAGAEHVIVEVKKREMDVFFRIKDGGRGFDMKKLESKSPHEKGLGFSSMDERVRMLGGHLGIDSQPGKGTTISFTIPY